MLQMSLEYLIFVFGEVWKNKFWKNTVFVFKPIFPSYKNSPNHLKHALILCKHVCLSSKVLKLFL